MAGFVGAGVVGTARIALVGVDPAPEWLVPTGTLLFGCVFPWLGGRYWRQSRALAEAGWLRAARLEDEQRHAEDGPDCANGPGSPRTCTTPSATN